MRFHYPNTEISIKFWPAGLQPHLIIFHCRKFHITLRKSIFEWNLINILLQEPLCSSERLECVENVTVDTSKCMKSCSGLIVTSFSKEGEEKNLDHLFKPIVDSYNNFKKISAYPFSYKGLEIMHDALKYCQLCILDFEWKNKLRYVRIYFDSPTFDIITKDRAAKFTDMLSSIGGTMGLLTGFSIISAVEIAYFSMKIVLNVFSKSKKNVLADGRRPNII